MRKKSDSHSFLNIKSQKNKCRNWFFSRQVLRVLIIFLIPFYSEPKLCSATTLYHHFLAIGLNGLKLKLMSSFYSKPIIISFSWFEFWNWIYLCALRRKKFYIFCSLKKKLFYKLNVSIEKLLIFMASKLFRRYDLYVFISFELFSA
jgi:hypothetical protein